MSMLRHARNLAARTAPRRVPAVRLVESVRAPEELPFADEYGAETTIVYTRAAPAGWPRRSDGSTPPTSSRSSSPAPPRTSAGRPAFAEQRHSSWSSWGTRCDAIRVERYGPTA